MAEQIPVRQQIADKILAALDGIWTAGGNAVTLKVQEGSSLGNVPTDSTCVLYQDSSEASTAGSDAPLGSIEWLTTWAVQVFISEPPKTGVSPRTRARTCLAEILNLLSGSQWGGLVYDTLPTQMQWFDNAAGQGALDGFTLFFTTRHLEQLGNAYQQR